MLCAFHNINELNKCASLLGNNLKSTENDVVTFQISHVNSNVAPLYAVLLSDEVVKADKTSGGSVVAALKNNLPTVSTVNTGTIEAVWCSQDQSWGACIDVLHSFMQDTINSNAVATQGPPSVVLEDCGFLLDSVFWPPLTADPNSEDDIVGTGPQLQSDIESCGRWSIRDVQSLSALLEGLSVGGSWEILDLPSPPPLGAGAGAGSPAPKAPAAGASAVAGRGTVRTYRDAALASPSQTASAAAAAAAAATSAAERASKRATAQWKPTFMVQKTGFELKDRLYQHNLVAKGIDPNALQCEDDDEDDAGELSCGVILYDVM
jgi:hypothetical protein